MRCLTPLTCCGLAAEESPPASHEDKMQPPPSRQNNPQAYHEAARFARTNSGGHRVRLTRQRATPCQSHCKLCLYYARAREHASCAAPSMKLDCNCTITTLSKLTKDCAARGERLARHRRGERELAGLRRAMDRLDQWNRTLAPPVAPR